MKSKRSRTYLVSGLTLALIFVAIILVFRDVLPDIVKDLSTVPFWGVLLLLALGFAYEAMESVLCLVIIHHKKPDCTFIDALRVTFLGVFGNITTLGAGTLPMQSFYLYRRGLDAGSGLGIMASEYVLHKISVLIYATVALLLGGGYGWLLNKIKGGEMMVATYVGFSSVSFMCMMWLLLPYKSPTMVWGFAGKGLRTTISLEGFYDQFLAKFLQIDLNRFGINLVIPTGSLLFFALLAFLMWVFLHTKTGTAMTAVGSNPTFAKAAGISVDKTRLLSVVLSTWLGAVGILLYEQGFGFVQIYMAPLNMAFPAVAAILIGGASVNKASITNVIIGTILYQGLVTMTPTVMNAIVHLDISEVIRIIVSNGMIVYALTRKTEGGK